jgi:precorrin-6B methylase 2
MRRHLPLASLLLAACAARAPAPEPSAEQTAAPSEDGACAEPPCEADDAPFLTALLDGPEPELEEDENPDGTEFDHTLGTEEPIDPFGVTPNDVVLQMLALAEVGKDDVVYDLGSGDGRIPIAAAKHAGARGVGIELRSELVEESRETAKAEGVARRVRFIEGDIFEADIREATVVMFYLYPRTTLKLRPKLLEELRPGTRIVAFDYGIESWPRDKQEPVPNPYRTEDLDYGTLYYYVIPANVSGTWKTSVALGAGKRQALVLKLEQTFQQVSGHAVVGKTEVPLRDVALRGDAFTFALTLPSGEALSFEGTASGNRLTGQVERQAAKADAPPARTSFKATRDPKTRTTIDLPQPEDEDEGEDEAE